MSNTHYEFDRTGNKPAGVRLGRAHESLDNAQRFLSDERDAMLQMRDGADYSAVTLAYGFTDNAEAEAAFLELDSLLAKIGTDDPTSSVKSAIGQFLARFRN